MLNVGIRNNNDISYLFAETNRILSRPPCSIAFSLRHTETILTGTRT